MNTYEPNYGYVTHWQDVVTSVMDLEEFTKITRALIFSRLARLPDKVVFVTPQGRRLIPEETEVLYDRCVDLMFYCGFEKHGDQANPDSWMTKHHGWVGAYLNKNDQVTFHCSIPRGSRRLISYAAFLEFKRQRDEAPIWRGAA
jgi:hypothetical protein